jgi:DNA-binding CsgD family transcriptional regulator
MLIPAATIAGLLLLTRQRQRQEIERRSMVERLTSREVEVLQLMAEGLDTRGLAERLSLGQTTVRTHVASVLGKLGPHSWLEAVLKATDLGLLRCSVHPADVASLTDLVCLTDRIRLTDRVRLTGLVSLTGFPGRLIRLYEASLIQTDDTTLPRPNDATSSSGPYDSRSGTMVSGARAGGSTHSARAPPLDSGGSRADAGQGRWRREPTSRRTSGDERAARPA